MEVGFREYITKNRRYPCYLKKTATNRNRKETLGLLSGVCIFLVDCQKFKNLSGHTAKVIQSQKDPEAFTTERIYDIIFFWNHSPFSNGRGSFIHQKFANLKILHFSTPILTGESSQIWFRWRNVLPYLDLLVWCLGKNPKIFSLTWWFFMVMNPIKPHP